LYPLSFLRERWEAFAKATHPADPGRLKPIFLTEYGVVDVRFEGHEYDSPDKGVGRPASDTPGYAVRLYENTLLYASMGAAVPFVWQAADQPWDGKAWGLVREDGQRRPSFAAMLTLLPKIPDGAVVLRQLEFDDRLTAAAFTDNDQLIVGLANAGSERVIRRLSLFGFSDVDLEEATAFHGGKVVEGKVTVEHFDPCRHGLEVTLEPRSTLTIVANAPAVAGC
jgi:hypothetical protein